MVFPNTGPVIVSTKNSKESNLNYDDSQKIHIFEDSTMGINSQIKTGEYQARPFVQIMSDQWKSPQHHNTHDSNDFSLADSNGYICTKESPKRKN